MSPGRSRTPAPTCHQRCLGRKSDTAKPLSAVIGSSVLVDVAPQTGDFGAEHVTRVLDLAGDAEAGHSSTSSVADAVVTT